MIKIEFPAHRKDIALAIGAALQVIGSEAVIVTDRSNYEPEYPDPPVEDSSDPDGLVFGPGGQPDAVDATGTYDLNGIPFNAEFCGKVKVSFYANGNRAGQWKKRKGVGDKEYDAWYAAQCGPGVSVPDGPAPVNTSAAFSEPVAPTVDVPQDFGAFMGWASERQAAGHISQEDITMAYAQLKIQVTDLIPPAPPETVQAHIAKLYEILS